MIYTIDPAVEEPIMLLDKHIGFDEEDGEGINSSLFARELLQLDNMGKKRIQIWINCPGGLVGEAYSIFSAMRKCKTPVDTYNMGIAASMGGVLFMGGRKRYMADYALLMMHSPHGSDDDHFLEVIEDSLVTMLSAECKLPEARVKEMVKATTWMNSAECFDKGFCTDIEVTSTKARKLMPKAGPAKAMWKQSTVILNSILKPDFKPQKKYTMSMNKLMNRMQLNPEASEESAIDMWDKVVDAKNTAEREVGKIKDDCQQEILRIQNKANAEVLRAKAEIDAANKRTEEVVAEKADVETNLSNVKNALTAKEKEFNDMKAKFDAMENEKNEAIAKEKKTKAETMVNAFVRSGRIKNDSPEAKQAIAKWTELAVNDYEGTKLMIEAIPLVAKAPVIMESTLITNPDGSQAVGTTAMALAVKNKLKRENRQITGTVN